MYIGLLVKISFQIKKPFSLNTRRQHSARYANKKEIDQDSRARCRSQVVTRRSINGQVKVSFPVCSREAAEVTQRHTSLISLHLLRIPVYGTSKAFTYPGMKWK